MSELDEIKTFINGKDGEVSPSDIMEEFGIERATAVSYLWDYHNLL